MSTKRTQVRFKLREDVLKNIEALAEKENRTLGNFIETKLLEISGGSAYAMDNRILPPSARLNLGFRKSDEDDIQF